MLKKSELKKQRFFVDRWLCDPAFQGWCCLRTRCTYCHKAIELSSSGLSLFNDHAKGKKHIAIVDKQKKSLNQNQNPQQKNPLNLVEKQLSQMSKHKKYWKCIFIFFSSSRCISYLVHSSLHSESMRYT